MALLNHFLVRYSAALVGINKFQDYLVLGDDVVIASKEVAEKYTSIMNGIGVSISESKRVFPSKDHSGVEFASQYICNDVDFSPLPIGNLFVRRVERLFSLWTMILERGHGAKHPNDLHTHGPDLHESFPLAGKAKGYEELVRL